MVCGTSKDSKAPQYSTQHDTQRFGSVSGHPGSLNSSSVAASVYVVHFLTLMQVTAENSLLVTYMMVKVQQMTRRL